MLKHFRNFAVVVITWYVMSFAGDLLAYVAQFAFGVVGDSARPGTIVLMHLVSGLPHIIVTPLAGGIAGSALRPRGEAKWLWLLATLFVAGYLVSMATGYPIGQWSVADDLGVALVAALLVGGVHLGGRIVRKRSQLASDSALHRT